MTMEIKNDHAHVTTKEFWTNSLKSNFLFQDGLPVKMLMRLYFTLEMRIVILLVTFPDMYWQFYSAADFKILLNRPTKCQAHLKRQQSWTNLLAQCGQNLLQVNLCQKLLFLVQLTHNMTPDCSWNYKFSTRHFPDQNMLRTPQEHVAYINCFCFDIKNNLCKQHVLNMFSSCSVLGNFMYWTCKPMNNLLSCCGLVDAKIRASDKDLPVLLSMLLFVRFAFLFFM